MSCALLPVMAPMYHLSPFRLATIAYSPTLAAKETVSVSGVDYVKPRLVTTQRVWDSLRLFFEDPDSGINGMNISVTNQNGASLPYQFDSATGRLSIPYSNETLNVLVPDNRGNVLELLLHP